MRRALAALIVRIAAVILPASQRDWSRAMIAEQAAIDRPGEALAFAFGCLAAALRQAWPPRAPVQIRTLAMLCAVAAVGLGCAHMIAAGAPSSYLAINLAALAIGLLAIGILRDAGWIWRAAGGAIMLALAAVVLATSLLGVSANGVTRWIPIGSVLVQPALIIVPVVVLAFARAPGAVPLLAILITALGVALQPDRAMAAALAGGMGALALCRPGPAVFAALAGALAALAATLMQADASPVMPFVDQIFFTAFDVHPLAGFALIAGAGLLLLPAIVGVMREPDQRAVYLAFGLVWLCLTLAAVIGNHPTPLVGYSGSAILAYLLSLLALPPRGAERIVTPAAESGARAAAAPGSSRRGTLTPTG